MDNSILHDQIAFYKKFFEAMSAKDFKVVTKQEIVDMLANFEQTLLDTNKEH